MAPSPARRSDLWRRLRSGLGGRFRRPTSKESGFRILHRVMARVTLREPSLVTTLIPVNGSATWVIIILSRPEGDRKACRRI